jgi:hypothetical protein
MIALIMEAARTFETLVNFYQTTRRYNPADSHLLIRPLVLIIHFKFSGDVKDVWDGEYQNSGIVHEERRAYMCSRCSLFFSIQNGKSVSTENISGRKLV